MNYEVTRLDGRHSWQKYFTYMIEFKRRAGFGQYKSSGVLEFDRARRWFNQTFGWSQDVETREDIVQALANNTIKDFDQAQDWNQAWAYSVKYNDYRIYVASEKELQWFVLAHANSNNE